jgi:hypothetical protein
MKRILFILSLILFVNLANAQDNSKKNDQDKVSYGKLDSLIRQQAKSYLDKTGELSSGKTRGLSQDACSEDMQNLRSAFANLKQAFLNCCKNESNDTQFLRAMANIYLITSNPTCSWGFKEYGYLTYYWLDYNELRDNLRRRGCNCGN